MRHALVIAAASESPATLENWEEVAQGDKRAVRYMCAQINTHYPKDLGTGYSAGPIRSAITLHKPL